jgi:SAM-dependent methyltransferase
VSENVFQHYSSYYDLLYRDKDYNRESDYVGRSIKGINGEARSLLEFGSGTGRHASRLAEQGFEVLGVERSESMVAAARMAHRDSKRSGEGSFRCMQGDVRTVSVDRTFDAVIALFHVVSYQTSNEDLRATFANAARHLQPGGLFLFDVWHGPAVLRQRPSVRIKKLEDERIRLTRIAEPELDTNASVVAVRYTMLVESKQDRSLVTFNEEHRMRYLFPVEIALLAERTGFRVERSEEFLTGCPPSEDTWGVAYLLRRAADNETPVP